MERAPTDCLTTIEAWNEEADSSSFKLPNPDELAQVLQELHQLVAGSRPLLRHEILSILVAMSNLLTISRSEPAISLLHVMELAKIYKTHRSVNSFAPKFKELVSRITRLAGVSEIFPERSEEVQVLLCDMQSSLETGASEITAPQAHTAVNLLDYLPTLEQHKIVFAGRQNVGKAAVIESILPGAARALASGADVQLIEASSETSSVTIARIDCIQGSPSFLTYLNQNLASLGLLVWATDALDHSDREFIELISRKHIPFIICHTRASVPSAKKSFEDECRLIMPELSIVHVNVMPEAHILHNGLEDLCKVIAGVMSSSVAQESKEFRMSLQDYWTKRFIAIQPLHIAAIFYFDLRSGPWISVIHALALISLSTRPRGTDAVYAIAATCLAAVIHSLIPDELFPSSGIHSVAEYVTCVAFNHVFKTSYKLNHVLTSKRSQL